MTRSNTDDRKRIVSSTRVVNNRSHEYSWQLCIETKIAAKNIWQSKMLLTVKDYTFFAAQFTILCCCREWLAMSSSVRLSVCLSLSVVCNVRALYSGEIFRNVSMPFGTLAILDLSVKILGRLSQGISPPSGELNTRGVAEYSDFGPIERYISETVQDRSYISSNH